MTIRTAVLTAVMNVRVYYRTLGEKDDDSYVCVCVSKHVHPGMKWPGEEFT
jgi:hypothetical protein